MFHYFISFHYGITGGSYNGYGMTDTYFQNKLPTVNEINKLIRDIRTQYNLPADMQIIILFMQELFG